MFQNKGACKCSVLQSVWERLLEVQTSSCLLCSGAPPGCVLRPRLHFP